MKTRRLGWWMLIICCMLVGLWLALAPNFIVHASDGSASVGGLSPVYPPALHDSQFFVLRHTANISFTPAFTTYVPLISNLYPKPPAGIYGRVTYQGTPVGNMQVELWRCDYVGDHWTCSSLNQQFTSTDQDGNYQFTTAPSLGTNQKYEVSCYNDDPRYLFVWNSFSIYTYSAGQVVAGGDFDIADIVLVSPDDGITATLPITFQWVPRSATPSDSYQVGLVNFDTTDENWYSPQQGYASSYVLDSPPPGFAPGIHYAWGVVATSPNGGYGMSRLGRRFTVGSGNLQKQAIVP